jgi:membrane-associated phospholipid phosphatase
VAGPEQVCVNVTGCGTVWTMLALPPWYEILDTVCATVFFFLLLLRFWPSIRTQWRQPGATPAFFMALGLMALFVIAEDVLQGDASELIPMLDVLVRGWMKDVAAHSSIRTAASTVSECTGFGLAVLIAIGTVWLAGTRRSRDAVFFAAGTIGAWALSGLLKVTFAVPRPGSIDRYGFPSGHTLVTLVAAGLMIYVLTRSAPGHMRAPWYALAVAASLVSGTSRMVLGAHWLSDVLAAVAIGTVWLGFLAFADSRRRGAAVLGHDALDRLREIAVKSAGHRSRSWTAR